MTKRSYHGEIDEALFIEGGMEIDLDGNSELQVELAAGADVSVLRQPRQAAEQGSSGKSQSEKFDHHSFISSSSIFGEFFAVEIIVIIHSTSH
jgi:hypothetical protein